MNGSGVAAGGLVRVELDGAGRLDDLFLDPRVAHLPVEELRVALISAFTSAAAAAVHPSSAAVHPSSVSVHPSSVSVHPSSAEAIELADRRFAEISTALYDLSRRAGRTW